MAQTVFLSFDPNDEDLASTFLVLAQKADPGIDFTDWSIKGEFAGPYGPYLRDRIRERIGECSALVCLLGENTWNDAWMAWEVRTAGELGKGVVAVRLHNSMFRDLTPQAVSDQGVTPIDWVTEDVIAAIHVAVQNAEAAA